MTHAAQEQQHDRRQEANGGETNATPFQRIGGAASVNRLVEAFYARMDSLPVAAAIRALHADDLSTTKEVLKRYLGEWMGGPKLYSQERGHPRLRQRHLRFKIGAAERDAWLTCMDGALQEIVADAPLRQELFASFAKLADWMRNQPGNPHDGRITQVGGSTQPNLNSTP
jgi:hemoglobin